MNFITEWVTSIILFVLLATVVDMLLPNSSFQKYTKMVAGLLLISIILTPILKLVMTDYDSAIATVTSLEIDEKKNIENSLELKKKEIQASQAAYILEQMAVQLERDAKEELMQQYGLEITKIDVLLNDDDQLSFPDNLNKLIVRVEQHENEDEAVEVVQKVIINTSQAAQIASNNEVTYLQNIASFLSEKWDVEQQSVEVQIEGGSTDPNG